MIDNSKPQSLMVLKPNKVILLCKILRVSKQILERKIIHNLCYSFPFQKLGFYHFNSICVLPLNVNFGVIWLILKKGYIHGVVEFFVLRWITFVSLLVRRVAEEYAFNGFRVKFTALGFKIMDRGCTSKYFQRNICKDTIGWVWGFVEWSRVYES